MIGEVYGAYEDLLRGGKSSVALPKLQRVAVVVTRKTIHRDALTTVLEQHAGDPGWIRLQSALFRTPSHRTAEPKDGLPLAAEWRLSKSESAHLRQDGKGGWTLYRYRDYASLGEADENRGDRGVVHECLCQWTTALAADTTANAADPDELAYYVYWGDAGGTIRRLFARFDGFRVNARG